MAPPHNPSSKEGDEPPYAKFAFLNPYNLSLLAGAGVTAAATGQWWIALCAAGAEAIWMLFAPDSKVLRAAWFDKMWDRSRQADVEERRNGKFEKLTPADKQRAMGLLQMKARIELLARENQSLAVDLLGSELAKMDALLEDFLDIALLSGRLDTHLVTFDLAGLQRRHYEYSQHLRTIGPSDPRREIAEKNIEVLEQRRKRFEDLRRSLEMARGQMELMENTFRLLADEIVTMGSPSELGARLEDLQLGMSAVRETSAEAELLYDDVADYEDSEIRKRA